MNQISSTAYLIPMLLPPGMDKLNVISAWTTGLVSLGLFIAFQISIGKTGFEALRHGRFEGGTASVIILVCAIILGAAAAIFTTFAVIG
ncbi:hypothetical protein GCM10028801_44640 [Nocardioides maradonensis]